MSEPSEPPMAWRYCGNQIKLWRTQAGVTREELGKAANYEPESVKSMEQGRRRPTLRLLEVADEICRARGLLVAAAEYLRPEKFPARTREFMALEAEAIVLHWYESLLIPGLLQTEDYARALMRGSCPPLDDERVEQLVNGRLHRQAKLTHRPTALCSFVIYEAALRSMVGGPACMKGQLHHLLEISTLRNVTIQILTAERGAYPALSGSLILLETGDHVRYAYVEAQGTAVLHSDAQAVSHVTQRHGVIRMQALCIEESAQFIRKVAGDL